MERKIVDWKVKGMNRDLSVSAFNPEFSYENFNVRLSTNEYNTTMSWVNERGTKRIKLLIADDETNTLKGTPIGTAVINHQLVIFTTVDAGVGELHNTDYIYVFKRKTDYSPTDKEEVTLEGEILYKGYLNFSVEHPLETLVDYEAGHVQKVYWTDGDNQPRVINIAASPEVKSKWKREGGLGEDIPDTYFDFIPAAKMNEKMTVIQNQDGGGIFPSGVIQYCYTYVNKYMQQTNIIEVSPIYYLIKNNRAASPEETVSCNFTITIEDLDDSFDMVRLYSIHRTALNLDVSVKLLEDIPIQRNSVTNDYSITFTDNGTTGSSVDPTEMLYIGGRDITAETMVDKDNTLFLGNLTEKHETVDQLQEDVKSLVENRDIDIEFVNNEPSKILNNKNLAANSYYSYSNTMKENQRVITTFKGGETYRFGFQLQKGTGEWSQPIFIKDKENSLYPGSKLYDDNIRLISAKSDIPVSLFDTDVYKKIRPVIVYPNIEDRSVLCQGVLNPTVFNVEDRKDKYPYAQASWFFRPYATVKDYENPSNAVNGLNINVAASSEEPTDTYDPWFNDKVSDVYIAWSKVRTNKVNDFLENCLLKGILIVSASYDDGTSSTNITINKNIKGAIQLDAYSYIFILDTPLIPNDSHYGNLSVEYLTDVAYSYDTFKMYNNMSVTPYRLYYYKKVEGAPDNFLFKCKRVDTYFTFNFKTVQNISNTSFTATSGSAVPFTHYESLTTIEDYLVPTEEDGVYKFKEMASKRMEIQGSCKLYDEAAILDDGEDIAVNEKKTNAQFFIDQSIVTLNSPDIEFDTEVQTYQSNNLHLRVIGAIPITANVSSHRITNASPMLETDHKSNQRNGITDSKKLLWGAGEAAVNVGYTNISVKAGNRLVAEYLWNDSKITEARVSSDNDWDGVDTDVSLHNYMVFPWQRSGSLNNDQRDNNNAAANLEKKKISNLLFSHNTEYLQSPVLYNNISTQIALTENAEVMNYRLRSQNQSNENIDFNSSEINYYPNVDKLLYNTSGYYILPWDSVHTSGGETTDDHDMQYNVNVDNVGTFSTGPVLMKYKSTSHAVVALNAYYEIPVTVTGRSSVPHFIPILPYCEEPSKMSDWIDVLPPGEFPPTIKFGEFDCHNGMKMRTFWGDTLQFEQQGIYTGDLFKDLTGAHTRHNFLWLGELYKEPAVRFGGTSNEAIRHNNWVPCGEAVKIDKGSNTVTIKWTEGDTYYQRYDCLKTYAFTPDDPNQLVEILSFMCETHVNIDGRYDNNRGQLENHDMDPSVFNLLNTVYSQQNNFFTYKQFDTSDWVNGLKYPNQVYFSKPKTAGEDVDTWTNVTMSSIVDLDGDKGEITSLQKFGSGIITFQDSGIAQLLYNENAQIAPQVGVPIELANSGKVQGARYFSDHIGCSNKWSIANTPNGIYFMDSNEKSIYLFNGQLTNLSGGLGFNTWAKNNIPSGSVKWKPDGSKAFTSFYNKLSHSVLFVNSDTALAYSEDLKAFTSFYNYEGAPYFNNVDDIGIWISTSRVSDSGDYLLYKHRAGDYCNIFDVNVPYSMKFVCNPDPALDKIFSNIEMRATAYDVDDKELGTHEPYLPFDNVIVENEYQYGATTLRGNNGINSMRHFLQDTDNTLKRKFRIWRCDVPRDQNVSTNGRYRMDRMRNPWVYLKLIKDAAEDDARLPRTEIHDVMMHYYI